MSTCTRLDLQNTRISTNYAQKPLGSLVRFTQSYYNRAGAPNALIDMFGSHRATLNQSPTLGAHAHGFGVRMGAILVFLGGHGWAHVMLWVGIGRW